MTIIDAFSNDASRLRRRSDRLAPGLLLPLFRHRRGAGGCGLRVEVPAGAGGRERVIQLVDKGDARGNVELRDVVVADVVEVLDEGAQGVAVRGHQAGSTVMLLNKGSTHPRTRATGIRPLGPRWKHERPSRARAGPCAD